MAETRLSIEIAQLWVEAMEDSDLDEVMRLYAPRATLHLPGWAMSGRAHATKIGPLLLVESQDNDCVHIRWQRGHLGPMETAMGIAEGQIAEQWRIGPER